MKRYDVTVRLVGLRVGLASLALMIAVCWLVARANQKHDWLDTLRQLPHEESASEDYLMLEFKTDISQVLRRLPESRKGGSVANWRIRPGEYFQYENMADELISFEAKRPTSAGEDPITCVVGVHRKESSFQGWIRRALGR